MDLIQITSNTWHIVGANVLIEFDADSEADAMSYAVMRYPTAVFTLDVQTFARDMSNLFAEIAA